MSPAQLAAASQAVDLSSSLFTSLLMVCSESFTHTVAALAFLVYDILITTQDEVNIGVNSLTCTNCGYLLGQRDVVVGVVDTLISDEVRV